MHPGVRVVYQLLMCFVLKANCGVLEKQVTKYENETVELACYTDQNEEVEWGVRSIFQRHLQKIPHDQDQYRRIYSTTGFQRGFNSTGRYSIRRENGYYNLTIKNLNISETGEYFCVENQGFRLGRRIGTQLSVYVNVSLLQSDGDSSLAIAGSNVTLPCRRHVDAPVRWLYIKSEKSSQDVIFKDTKTQLKYEDRATVVQTARDYNLSLYNMQLNQSGFYICIEDGLRFFMNPIRLTVLVNVSTLESFQNITVDDGDHVTLPCRASVGGTVRWFHSRSHAAPQKVIFDRNTVDSKYLNKVTVDNDNSSRDYNLTLLAVQLNEFGWYICYIDYDDGKTVTHPFLLTIEVTGLTLKPSQELTVCEGDSVTLPCRASLKGTVTWFYTRSHGTPPHIIFDQNAVDSKFNNEVTVNNDHSSPSYDLSLRAVQLNKYGWYICYVEDEYGRIFKHSFHLAVKVNVSTLASPEELTVNNGENVTVSCRPCRASLGGTVKWFHIRSQEAPQNVIFDRNAIDSKYINRVTVDNLTRDFNLSLHVVQLNEFGWYICYVEYDGDRTCIHPILLTVTEQEESPNNRVVAVTMGASVSIIAFVVIIAAIFIVTRRKQRQNDETVIEMAGRTSSDEETIDEKTPLSKVEEQTSEDIRARLEKYHSTLARIVKPSRDLNIRMQRAGFSGSHWENNIDGALNDLLSLETERDLRTFSECLKDEGEENAYSLLIGKGTVAHIIATINAANNREQRERLIVDRLNLLTHGLVDDDLQSAGPYDVQPVDNLQRRLNERLNRCLDQFKEGEITIAYADIGSIELFFIAKSKRGFEYLHKIYFNQQLKSLMEEIFILISNIDLRVENLRWDPTNYADCLQRFKLPILPILAQVYEMAKQNQKLVRTCDDVRSIPIDQLPDELFEMYLVQATVRLFVTINRMTKGRAEVYTLATMMAVSCLWWKALIHRKYIKRSIKRSLKGVCHPYKCSTQHVTRLHIAGVYGVCGAVCGVAVLNDKLYVACKRSKIIRVFDSRPPSSRREEIKKQTTIEIKGLKNASDITVCSKSSQLYIADKGQSAIWRLRLLSDEPADKFITIQYNRENNLSVNSSRLLISDGKSLYLYGDDGNELHHIKLPRYMEALHAVETTHNTYIVSHWDRSIHDKSHGVGVTEIDVKGQVIRTFNNDIHSIHFSFPSYLVLDNDHVLVADSNESRITLLKSDLQLKRIFIDKYDWEPLKRMFLTSSRLLIVGYNSYIDVFKV